MGRKDRNLMTESVGHSNRSYHRDLLLPKVSITKDIRMLLFAGIVS